MAGRFVNPFPQFLDATPTVRAGAKLFFYAAGTSTKLNTYSDRSLSSANTNPVVLNSAGYPSVDIYLQDLDYKVVLATSTDSDPPASPIWSADYVRGRDSALIAKTLTGSGSPNLAVAGTAGSSSILPDFYWDYTNSIFYVCTTTGTSSTALWTALNASAATPSVPYPQGRLTLTSATPILAADVTSATAVYYTPYTGNLVAIYNGATMVPTEFAELTLTLSASHALSTIYDVFVFSNSGVVTLATGPAWSNSSAGSGARGTGASTTELTRIKGLWVNAVSMTGRNGATTYTIGANAATYVGSIFVDGTAGQITCHRSYGQSRKWGVWNAYNRAPITMKAGDSTASWSYNTNTTRAANATSANSITIFAGLPEEQCTCIETQKVQLATSNFSTVASYSVSLQSQVSLGLNSTSSPSGTIGNAFVTITQSIGGGGTLTYVGTQHNENVATLLVQPWIGINTINMQEITPGNTGGGVTYFGTETNMLLTSLYRG